MGIDIDNLKAGETLLLSNLLIERKTMPIPEGIVLLMRHPDAPNDLYAYVITSLAETKKLTVDLLNCAAARWPDEMKAEEAKVLGAFAEKLRRG